MENFQWIAPLKSAVLLMFFMAFSLLLTSALLHPEDERLRRLPLEPGDEEVGS